MTFTQHPRFITLVGEVALALWLVVVGVNEEKWRAQVAASAAVR